jgi:hypothetical protein
VVAFAWRYPFWGREVISGIVWRKMAFTALDVQVKYTI